MKTKKIILDFEEEEQVSVGVISLKNPLYYHEFFFKINQLNTYNFCRGKDLCVEDYAGYYDFVKFETYDEYNQNHIVIFANQSHHYQMKQKDMLGLFDLIDTKFFIDEKIDFIVFSKSGEMDFSLLLPEDAYPMTIMDLMPNDELTSVILNYDE